MTTSDSSLGDHPAPHRNRVSTLESAFTLVGGPLAWFVQLCAGYAMSSWPCFPMDQRRLSPVNGYAWTWTAILIVSIASLVIALAAYLLAHRTFQRTKDEGHGDHRHVLEVGTGRTRFLAVWGMVLGAGFAAAIALTGAAFFLLPRCAG